MENTEHCQRVIVRAIGLEGYLLLSAAGWTDEQMDLALCRVEALANAEMQPIFKMIGMMALLQGPGKME